MDTVSVNSIGTEPNYPLDYVTGLEHHCLTMSKLGGARRPVIER